MTYSKLSKWLKRGALTLVACAAVAVLSTEQASAQGYGGRGGSFGRGSGINVSVGNLGLSLGFNNSRGYSNNFNRSPYRGPGVNAYRPPVRSYGGGRGGNAVCPYTGRRY